MVITWKDAATTALAVATGALAYAKYQGWQNFLMGPRVGVLALGLIGIGMCAVGASPGLSQIWGIGLSVLGAIALVIVLLGLITGSKLLFFALAADILVLWLLSTARHFMANA